MFIDAAVTAFRKRISEASRPTEKATSVTKTSKASSSSVPISQVIPSNIVSGSNVDKAIQKSKKERKRLIKEPSNLERYVGRTGFKSTSLCETVERFPELKNAPVEGSFVNSVSFKPLGKEIRYTRCARCQIWGHQSGDRECPMINDNPNDASRLVREDPMMMMHKKRKSVMSNDGKEYDLLISSEDDERDFVASLSTKQKKKLLKKLKKRRK